MVLGFKGFRVEGSFKGFRGLGEGWSFGAQVWGPHPYIRKPLGWSLGA